jgi:hypothetical protein
MFNTLSKGTARAVITCSVLGLLALQPAMASWSDEHDRTELCLEHKTLTKTPQNRNHNGGVQVLGEVIKMFFGSIQSIYTAVAGPK